MAKTEQLLTSRRGSVNRCDGRSLRAPARTIDPPWWQIGPMLMIPALVVCTFAGGCSLMGGGDPDLEADERLEKLLKSPDPPGLIREAAIAHGMRPIRVDGVALVNALSGTGGPVNPSVYRDQLLDEMRRESVEDPNLLLERDDTGLVQVSGIIPPGAKRGDPMDIKVVVPSRSMTTDLHGGWLLDTRMQHQQLIQSAVRRSDVMAISIGRVLTKADYTPSPDDSTQTEGRILAGGRVQIDRKLGLLLRPEYKHVKMASRIQKAINRRFFFFDGSTRRGIANAVEDDFIEIEVHPRYRGNEQRMMAVIRAIAIGADVSDPQTRLTELASRLRDPATAKDAALQLESMGDGAVPTLIEGTKSANPELRFYAAEALAYLDRSEAVAPLEEAAREVLAFRYPSIAALQRIDLQLAVDALQNLMNMPSLETRYGAFCALRRRTDARLVLHGSEVGNECRLYEVASAAAPAVVVSLRETAEIVLFGDVSPLQLNGFLRGPDGLIVRVDPQNPSQIRISRFRAGRADERSTAAATVRGLVGGVAAVGGCYGDIVAVLRQAKETGAMVDQFGIDPLPKSLRMYHREDHADLLDEESESEGEIAL